VNYQALGYDAGAAAFVWLGLLRILSTRAFKPFLIIITAAVIYFSSKCPWLPEKLMVSMPGTRGPLKASGCGQRSNIFT
jgi:hypothetical protein